jgi:hypothetical protein
MSEENVETVREAHERFTKTGQPIWERIDADTEVFDHDIPDARNPYRGADSVADWLSDFAEAWDSYGLEVERLIDAGDRVALSYQRGWSRWRCKRRAGRRHGLDIS